MSEHEIAPDRRPLETRQQRWPAVLARRLSDAGCAPNLISVAGLVAGTAAAGAFVAAHTAPSDTAAGVALLLAGGCVQLRLLCNMLDGLVAVECGRGGPTGDFFNEVPDRVEDALILGAAGWAAGWPVLGAVAAWCALATAYVRAYRVTRGHGQDFCGPGEKPHRMFVVTVGAVAAAVAAFAGARPAVAEVLTWTVATVAVLAGVTTVRRGWRTYRAMAGVAR